MTTTKLNTEDWLASLDETILQLLQLASSFTEKEFNSTSLANSWNAAQVCEHTLKAIQSIAGALSAKGDTTEREPDQRVAELRELFLDFTKKFQSPLSVLPTRSLYKKDTFIFELKKSIEQVKVLSKTVNLFETASIPGFGELTKLELLHFIVFHTQRHIHQLKNIRIGRN